MPEKIRNHIIFKGFLNLEEFLGVEQDLEKIMKRETPPENSQTQIMEIKVITENGVPLMYETGYRTVLGPRVGRGYSVDTLRA